MTYEIFTLILFILFGLVFASFGNMLAYRLKYNESTLTRSHCEKCKHKLGTKDLIPVFSFVCLRGKCRYCRERISIRELIGEVFLAFISALWGYLFIIGNIDALETLIYMAFSLAIFIIAISDALYLELPDELQIALMLIGSLNIVTHGNIFWNLFNIAFSGGLLLFTFMITGDRKMGFGDVKLAFGLGFFLNYFYFTVSILASSVAGILFAIAISKGNKKRLFKYRVPYGSFLGITTLLILLFLEARQLDPLIFEKLVIW